MLIVDSVGRAVPGIVVNFVVTGGSGSVFAPAVQTSSAGVANQQWTLGTKASVQTLEVRWIDPTTGAARVLGIDSVTALPGAVQRLSVPTALLGDQPSTYLGGRINVRTLVSAADQYGNTITSPSLTILAPSAWRVVGDTIIAPNVPGAATIQVVSGSATGAFTAYAVEDLRRFSFTASWSCTYLQPFTYNGATVDSSFSTMVVDSVRASSDPGPRRGIPAFASLRYILYASGTTTHHLHGAGAVTIREVRDIGIVRQWPDTITVEVATALGGVPTDGTLPSTRTSTDPAIALMQGPLYRSATSAGAYSSGGTQLMTACVGNPYPLHAMVLTGR